MQIEKREIEHLSTGKALLLWMMKKNRKDVELERIDKNHVRLSTEIITDEVFEKVAYWRVFLYKYLPMFLISLAFLVHLSFNVDTNRYGYSNVLVSAITIFTSLSMAILFFENNQRRNIEKKILLFIFIFFLGFCFYFLKLYIEFLMAMHLAPAFLIIMILIKDISEERWKNTYFSGNIGAFFCYQNKEAVFTHVVCVSVTIVTLMLLLVQK